MLLVVCGQVEESGLAHFSRCRVLRMWPTLATGRVCVILVHVLEDRLLCRGVKKICSFLSFKRRQHILFEGMPCLRGSLDQVLDITVEGYFRCCLFLENPFNVATFFSGVKSKVFSREDDWPSAYEASCCPAYKNPCGSQESSLKMVCPLWLTTDLSSTLCLAVFHQLRSNVVSDASVDK